MENQDYYIICFESLVRNQEHQKWNYRHRFHEDCIKNWNKGCPVCRTNSLFRHQKTKKNEKIK